MTWTHTMRGRALDLLDPKPEDISLREIARALAQQCRYAGNVNRYYSVAEHSIHIAAWLQDQGADRDLVLAGLLHDAAEAYTGDITWPMQAVLWEAAPEARDAYSAVQGRLDRLIAELAGIPAALLHDTAVKTADMRILLDERSALLGGPPPRPWVVESELGLKPLGRQILSMPPDVAEKAFLLWLDECGALR